jgi:hypothetical protein
VAVASRGGGGESGAGGCLGVSGRNFTWSWDFFLDSAATTDFPPVFRAKSHRRCETATTPRFPRVSSCSRAPDDRFPAGLLVSIRDTGKGIPERYLKKVFEPYFTLKPGGTGLGMALTKRIIEDHKGTIVIESVEGKGTTVTITLPAA